MSSRLRRASLVIAGLVVVQVAGCQAPAVATKTQEGQSGLAHAGIGASVLAAVGNARAALALHDRLAASNDIAQAVTTASQLPGLPSPLFPDGGIAKGRNQGNLNDFALRVDLANVQADLGNGDVATAESTLTTIQKTVPQNLIPPSLPLLQASQSLDFAQSALSLGQTDELHTHLQIAQQALKAASGAPQAQVLARVIGQSLRRSGDGGIGAYQPSQWKATVDSWG